MFISRCFRSYIEIFNQFLACVHVVKDKGTISFFLHMGISSPSAIFLRDCPVPVCILGAFVEDQLTTCMALFQDSWQ